MRRLERGVAALSLGLLSAAGSAALEQPGAGDAAEWLVNSVRESFTLADGATLRFEHSWGDVRVEAGETDHLHVTALAQYHRDDPRTPSVELAEGPEGPRLVVEFTTAEVDEPDAWTKRRIDVGLLVPMGVTLDVRTDDGIIEAKKLAAESRLASTRGDIVYDGTGSVEARTERGSIRALLRETGAGSFATLSTLTGDVWCTLLEGAGADVTLETRGTVTTDFTVEIDREAGSALKRGRARIGEGGTVIDLTSHSGGLRLQGLIVPEDRETNAAETPPGPP